MIFLFLCFFVKKDASSLLLRSYLQQFSFLFVHLKKKKGKKRSKLSDVLPSHWVGARAGRQKIEHLRSWNQTSHLSRFLYVKPSIKQKPASWGVFSWAEQQTGGSQPCYSTHMGALHTYVGFIGSETKWVGGFFSEWSKNNATLNVCRTTFFFFMTHDPSLPLCWGWEPSHVFLLFNFVLQCSIHTHICNIFSSVKVLSHWAIGEATWINDAKMQIFRWRIFPVHT